MIRVKCSGCGKTVRGGDDWSGRSANCPKCGAVIFFPQIETEFGRAEAVATEAAGRSTALSKIAKIIEYPNLGWAKTLAVVAATGVSLWIWFRLIIILAYGRWAYFVAGLRVASASKSRGITLNNGNHLNFFWDLVFTLGFLGLWFLLMDLAEHLAKRVRRKSLVIWFIVLLGCATWYSVLWQLTHVKPKPPGTFYPSPLRHYLTIAFAIALVGCLTYWRLRRSKEAE